MSCPALSSAANACAANSGVPAKTRRRKVLGALAKLLCKPRANALLLELREAFDEHLALQVIHFVLDADRKQSLCLEREQLAVLVVGAHLDALGPLQRVIDAGNRKTALLDIRD